MNTGALQLALLAKDRRRRPRIDDDIAPPAQLELSQYLQRVNAPLRWRPPRDRKKSSPSEAELPPDAPAKKRGPSYAELCDILRTDERVLGGKPLRFDDMLTMPTLDGKPLDDAAAGRLREKIELLTTLRFGAADLESAMHQLSWENRFNPVAEYLRKLEWDGVERIGYVAEEVLGIEQPSELTQTMLRKWFIGAVARPLVPGCKMDTVLILTGRQGVGKSTFFAVLVGDQWFSDSPIDLQNKDAMLTMRRVWVLEWAELETMQRARDYAAVKAFITSRVDTYRAPYARRLTNSARHCVIVGTTNDDEFLSDPTGNRRYWIIRVPGRVDTAKLAGWRDQLWAEAVAAFRAQESWWLNEKQEAELRELQQEFLEHDAWEEPVQAFLKATSLAPITSGLVLERALGKTAAACTSGDKRRLARVLRRLGYADLRKRNEQGQQFRAWEPVTDVTDGDGCTPLSSVTTNAEGSPQLTLANKGL